MRRKKKDRHDIAQPKDMIFIRRGKRGVSKPSSFCHFFCTFILQIIRLPWMPNRLRITKLRKTRFLLYLWTVVFFHCQVEEKEHPRPLKPLPTAISKISVVKETEALPPHVVQPEPSRTAFNSRSKSDLVSQYIRRIYQDRKGNLWFGTVGDGVCNYDGSILRYFTRQQGLNDCSVQEIKEDKKGRLWFATTKGLIVYDDAQFKRYGEKDGLPSEHIQSLLIDRSGAVWAGTDKGLFMARAEAEEGFHFENIPFLEPEERREIKCLLEDRNGTIWFSPKQAGLYNIRPSQSRQSPERVGLPGADDHLLIYHLAQDAKGYLWLATAGSGLCRYDPLSRSPTTTPFLSYKEEKGSNECWYVLIDSHNNLWVSVRGAVRCYTPDHQAGNLLRYIRYGQGEGLNNCCTQCIFEDQTGAIWLGTGEGLFRIPPDAAVTLCMQNKCGHRREEHNDQQAHEALTKHVVRAMTKTAAWPVMH
jgi:ligand-binding sensor domain-containing protein